MKETKIEIPADCEVCKVETQDGHIVVTFREKERKLPKSWKEFCEMFPIKDGECYISSTRKIEEYLYHRDLPRKIKDKNILPDRATAEAVLALCQLIQLRNCYNGDWVQDWNNGESKFFIQIDSGEIKKFDWYSLAPSPLYFKTMELRDEFLRCFRPLIEKLKPLYGIKEGGEE